jgi:hypothetical protein
MNSLHQPIRLAKIKRFSKAEARKGNATFLFNKTNQIDSDGYNISIDRSAYQIINSPFDYHKNSSHLFETVLEMEKKERSGNERRVVEPEIIGCLLSNCID